MQSMVIENGTSLRISSIDLTLVILIQASCMLVIILTYLMGTNFFWMFVEGLYLYILVVKTFSIELVKVHVYTFIGWGKLQTAISD